MCIICVVGGKLPERRERLWRRPMHGHPVYRGREVGVVVNEYCSR